MNEMNASLAPSLRQDQAVVEQIDLAVTRARARNTASFPVKGVPFLRANRFLIGLQEQIQTEEEFDVWAGLLRQEDQKARWKEIRNIPYEKRQVLADKFGMSLKPEVLISAYEGAAGRLFNHYRTKDFFRPYLFQTIEDPTEYVFWRRAIGLYPLFALPVDFGAERTGKKFEHWLTLPIDSYQKSAESVSFAGSSQTGIISTEKITALFKQAPRNDFQMLLFSHQDINLLAAAFAPVYHQDIESAFDQFGSVVWRDHQVAIDTAEPTVYYYTSYQFIDGKPLFQLNYSHWYAARAGQNAPWIERGRLDGLTVRLSFDEQGRLVMTDIMNSCGCYHFMVPNDDLVETNPDALRKPRPVIVPKSITLTDQARLHVVVNAGWHQVQRVAALPSYQTDMTYVLRPYDELESLPQAAGIYESVFDEQGIMKGSTRFENILFFSMGIPKVGYMRQRGQHPITLVGEKHFTDADLFNADFQIK